MKTKRLTIADHQEIGCKLKEIRNILVSLAVVIPNACGNTSRAGKSAIKVFREVDRLRSELEDVCCRDYPAEFNLGIYYQMSNKELIQRGR